MELKCDEADRIIDFKNFLGIDDLDAAVITLIFLWQTITCFVVVICSCNMSFYIVDELGEEVNNECLRNSYLNLSSFHLELGVSLTMLNHRIEFLR